MAEEFHAITIRRQYQHPLIEALLARSEAGTLRHDADPRLAEHVTAAGVKHSNDAGVVLSRRASSGPIAAAVATALAVYGVAGPEPAAPAVL